MGIKNIQAYLFKPVSILPLAIFRIAFGFLLCFSQLRFIAKGWVDDCYINPSFHFTYQYFNWVHPFTSETMYLIVALCAISAFCIGLGLFYRFSTILFFISFTYLELIEKSWYLNHYYFVSLVAFLLIWLPANNKYAIDPLFKKGSRTNMVPRWTVDILKFQLVIVYFFGGIAKLKPDWLLHAQPLKIWLKARTDFPIIGSLFDADITAFLFSWSGTLYDLCIPFLLWTKRTRPIAYILVILFHILTYMLFNIGMFPWLMMAGSLIFITASEWKNLLQKLKININLTPSIPSPIKTKALIVPLILLYGVLQITIPLRHYFLSDNVLWSENGIRFAWHVMVMEKNGFTEFKIIDQNTKKKFTVYPSQHLTPIQEKQMSFQPDMIWQFAQYLEKKHNTDGSKKLAIYVNSKVSLNGRPSQTYIDSNINLLHLTSVNSIYDYIEELQP